MPIFTLGYEGLDLNAFVQILLDNGVECLLDVRQRPQSRKRGFSKTALVQAPELKQAIANLAFSAWNKRCCLMCFEADENFCHRLFVARAVEAAGGPDAVHLNRNSLLSALGAPLMMN